MKIVNAKQKQIEEYYKQYFQEIPRGINGYLEKRILSSSSFLIVDGDIVGIFSVDDDLFLTGFYLIATERERYSELLSFVIEKKGIKSIYMSTEDKKLLKEINRRDYIIETHTYNFSFDIECISNFDMVLVSVEEVEDLIPYFGEFLEYNNVDPYTKKMYIHVEGGEPICLGFYEKYKLINGACVAMIVNPKYLNQGYGTKTLQFLISHLQKGNINVTARCWVQNIASKKTILRAGFTQTSEVIKVKTT